MARLNSEFNYRYQVIGETVWAKIQTLKEFLGGRERAAALETVAHLKWQSKLAERDELRAGNATASRLLAIEAEIVELESFREVQAYNFAQNREEIACLKRLLAEYYAIAEPTRQDSTSTPFQGSHDAGSRMGLAQTSSSRHPERSGRER